MQILPKCSSSKLEIYICKIVVTKQIKTVKDEMKKDWMDQNNNLF